MQDGQQPQVPVVDQCIVLSQLIRTPAALLPYRSAEIAILKMERKVNKLLRTKTVAIFLNFFIILLMCKIWT